ncbi:unnamed protein product [Knipowitschia caucasica]
MEEEATSVGRSSTPAASSHGPADAAQTAAGSTDDLLVPSFSPSSEPSSPTPAGTSTLTRLSMSLRGGTGQGPPASPTERGQVSAITVMALLDKLVLMLGTVQENQQRMEARQEELEGAVRTVQSDVVRLSRAHLSTSSNVNKLLERSRKVSGGVKEVKERLEKQGGQVKRLENNHAHLLKRNHFKVLIFQEDNEIPTDVYVQESLKSPSYDTESVRPGSVAPSMAPSMAPSVAASVSIAPSVAGSERARSPEGGLHSISLSSDDEDGLPLHRELPQEGDADSTLGLQYGPQYERRSDRFKRNSLKKVDSLKKAFSKQNIEKRVTQITTKIVPPEKREKLIKSLTPNHPKSPTARASSFRVTPMTFNVKKVRDGQTPTPEASPTAGGGAHVEIPAMVLDPPGISHTGTVGQVREALTECSVQAEYSVNGDVNGEEHSVGEEVSLGGEVSVGEVSVGDGQSTQSPGAPPGEQPTVQAGAVELSVGLAEPESVDDVGEEDDDDEEGTPEQDTPAEGAPEVTVTAAAAVAVEQAS